MTASLFQKFETIIDKTIVVSINKKENLIFFVPLYDYYSLSLKITLRLFAYNHTDTVKFKIFLLKIAWSKYNNHAIFN